MCFFFFNKKQTFCFAYIFKKMLTVNNSFDVFRNKTKPLVKTHGKVPVRLKIYTEIFLTYK